MEDNLVYAGFCAVPVGVTLGVYWFFIKHRQHKSGKPRWWKLVLGNLLVFLLAGSLAALAGESYYRFWYDSTDSFAMTKTCLRWFDRHYEVNTFAVRDDRNYRRTPEAGKRRITFVGDSFTAGHGVADVHDRFANRIRKAHPEWEIHVMARLGLDSGDELKLLEELVKGGYKLDQVVLVYNMNDINDVNPDWERRFAIINERYKRQRPGFLVEHSYLLNTLYYRMWTFVFPEIFDYYRGTREAYLGPLWETHSRRLKAMRDLVQSHGGRLCVATFPFLNLLGPNYAYRDVHKKLDDYWRSIGVPHLDLLPVYESHTARELMVNSSDAHPNELAHALAAEAIGPFLEQEMRAKEGDGTPDSATAKPQ